VIPGYAPLPDVDERGRRVFVQRRRLAVAIVVTVVAVIVSLASSSNDTPPAEQVATAAVGTSGSGDVAGISSPADPAFLPGAKDTSAPEIITVNVPAPRTGTVITGRASFIRWPQTLGLAPCATPHALIGAKITVTNLNNARSIVCDNVSIESLSGGNTIIIHSDVFLEIADLVDAPIPVEIEF
jgi:hypothetical protein